MQLFRNTSVRLLFLFGLFILPFSVISVMLTNDYFPYKIRSPQNNPLEDKQGYLLSSLFKNYLKKVQSASQSLL